MPKSVFLPLSPLDRAVAKDSVANAGSVKGVVLLLYGLLESNAQHGFAMFPLGFVSASPTFWS